MKQMNQHQPGKAETAMGEVTARCISAGTPVSLCLVKSSRLTLRCLTSCFLKEVFSCLLLCCYSLFVCCPKVSTSWKLRLPAPQPRGRCPLAPWGRHEVHAELPEVRRPADR